MTPAAVILSRVLLPAMFGPVNSTCLATPPPSWTLFEMNDDLRHMDGCLNSVKSMKASVDSTNVGRHFGSSIPIDAFASETRQSSSATTRTAFNHSVRSLSNSTRRVPKNARLATK